MVEDKGEGSSDGQQVAVRGYRGSLMDALLLLG